MTAIALAPWIVAVAQPTQALLDEGAALDQACEVIVDAGRVGARLVVLPMACFFGTSPARWSRPPLQEDTRHHPGLPSLANPQRVPGEDTDRLSRMAKRARACVVIGVQDGNGVGMAHTHTLLTIDAQGRILGALRVPLLPHAAHRPRAIEPSALLQVFELPEGPVRVVIGAEHAPVAAHALLHGRHADLYVAYGCPPGESMRTTLRRIARDERLYVIDIGALSPAEYQALGARDRVTAPEAGLARCASAIIGPDGETMAGIPQRHSPFVHAQIDLRKSSHARAVCDLW